MHALSASGGLHGLTLVSECRSRLLTAGIIVTDNKESKVRVATVVLAQDAENSLYLWFVSEATKLLVSCTKMKKKNPPQSHDIGLYITEHFFRQWHAVFTAW